MITPLFKCAAGLALLVSIAAAPFPGSDPAQRTEEAVATSSAFSAAMLDHSKSRWAREGRVDLVDLIDPSAELEAPVPQGGGGTPPGETTGGATQCPAVHTQCPPLLTTCPMIHTLCPVQPTVCKATECPPTTTVCPVNPTVCESTQCPANPTYCPSVGTLCPAIPTLCPLDPTKCPPVPTQCPASSTTCPVIPTVCPVDPTVCQYTTCPKEKTLCPITECPEPPVCIFTFDAGPPAGFAAPSASVPGSGGHLAPRVGQLGALAPTVTFLPALGG